jgi:hypothetical protein
MQLKDLNLLEMDSALASKVIWILIISNLYMFLIK